MNKDTLKEEKRLPELQTKTTSISPRYANVYIDESGYKNKSRNLSDDCEKKISVFVGVPVPTDKEKEFSNLFQSLFDKFKKDIPVGMKLHITDAFACEDVRVKSLAHEIRKGYLDIFKNKQIDGLPMYVLFGARRAEIEKKSFDNMQKLSSDSAAIAEPNLRINFPYSKETLEGKAFMSLVGKMEAFAEEFDYDYLTPLTDEISKNKKEEYMNLINEFRTMNYSEEKINLTAWDKINKKIARSSGKITSSTDYPIENRIKDIEVVGKDNPLILLADILANYIHNYMLDLPESAKLHSPNSYIDFDLRNNIYGLIDNWTDDYM